MSKEAADAAAFEAYAQAVREFNEQQQQQPPPPPQWGDTDLYAVTAEAAAAVSSPFHVAVDDEEVQHLLSMEETASRMLMERLTNDFSHTATNDEINSNNESPQVNEALLQELIGLAGGQPGTDDVMALQLLSILEQQKHQNVVTYETQPPVESTMVSNRQEKHFFTVAQDGT
jgi:hypothetical protein